MTFCTAINCMDGRAQLPVIAIVAHHDCAGNPIPDVEQRKQLRKCFALPLARYAHLEIVPLWLDQHWTVHEIQAGEKKP